MTLPAAARARLAAPLRLAATEPEPRHGVHTVPVTARMWHVYATHLAVALDRTALCVPEVTAAARSSWGHAKQQIDRLLGHHRESLGLLTALQPYEHFDRALAETVVHELKTTLERVAETIETADVETVDTTRLLTAAQRWRITEPTDTNSTLARTFGLERDPVDASGEFRPAAVLHAYKYRNSALLAQIAPHYESLGHPMAVDLLAAVSALGWFVSAPDPFWAHAAMDSFTGALNKAPPAVVTAQLTQYEGWAQSARQNRRRVVSALDAASKSRDEETRALELADAYKRLVEGPVRRHGWASRGLDLGLCTPAPMLTVLREALVAHGGLVGEIARASLLVGLRNAEVHEDLEWDGHQRVFLAGADTFPYETVRDAVAVALSFDRGCEAGLALYRSSRVEPTMTAPSADDSNRMPPWQRVEAYLGSNGFDYLTADLNSSTARIVVSGFEETDVNPCFQALLVARELLPRVEVFCVVRDDDEPLLTITSRALDQTAPVWSLARELFDRMPLATFLPANFAARTVREPTRTAAQAAAWIAVDDALGAVDGGPPTLNASARALLDNRLRLIETALSRTSALVIDDGSAEPLLETLADIVTLRDALEESHLTMTALLNEFGWTLDTPPLGSRTAPTDVASFVSAATFDDLPPTRRLRRKHHEWGPVPRLPTVAPEERDDGRDPEPGHRPIPGDLRWRTM